MSSLLKYNLGLCAGIFLLLEFWRPYYFLTDDNLCNALPFLTEMGRHLKSGQSPFYSDYVFGGHYNYLRDPMCFAWHPLYFLVSLLSDTPFRFCMIDLIAFCFLMLTAAGFVVLAFSLRRELELKLSDARLTFYTLSFVFSTFILTTGASWVNMLAYHSALPWLAFAILQKSWRRGLGLSFLFSVHQNHGGQLATVLSNDLFFSLFAVGVAFYRRSWAPLLAWLGGVFLALLVAAPLLLPAIDGFFHSQRGGGLDVKIFTLYAVPALTVPFSFFAGNYSELVLYLNNDPLHKSLEFPHIPMLFACAAAWCLLPALLSTARWHYLEILCLSMAGFLLLLIIRPLWISEVMLHVPILKSMRWPFREILQFQFFIHLFLVLRPQSRTLQFQNGVAIFSLVTFLLPLPFISVPTLNPLQADRELLLSGKLEKYWDGVKTQLQPGDEVVSVLDLSLWNSSWQKIPYGLLDTAGFPSFLKVRTISGYSLTAPLDQIPLKTPPYFWFGTYEVRQLKDVMNGHLDLKIIYLQSVDPLKITLLSHNHPPVDLTPYLSN